MTHVMHSVLILTAVPRHVSITTKYVIIDLDDCNCGSLPITVAMEGRRIPAVCVGMPTSQKQAAV